MSHRRKHVKKMNRHHLCPKSRNGPTRDENLLLLKIEKHVLLHKIFGNRTLGEILTILHRTLHAKNYEVVEICPICKGGDL